MIKKYIVLFIIASLFIACEKGETDSSKTDDEVKVEIEGNDPEETPVEPTGNLFLKINVPFGSVRKDIDKIHIVLYDELDNAITYKTHSSGEEEQLLFYSEATIGIDDPISIAFIYNFKNEVFSSKIYKDLSLSMIGEVLNLAPKAIGAKTGLINKPILGKESRWELRSSGRGYSILGFDSGFEGHYTYELYNDLGLSSAYIQYYNVDNIYDYSYKYLPIEELTSLSAIDVSTFTKQSVLSGSISIDLPYQNAYLQIYGYESLNKFKANSGHRLCFNPALLDFNGIYYSYADIFPYIKYSVQFKNYEIEGIGNPPQELTVPQKNIDYNYSNGIIAFEGLTDHEVGRFYLRNQSNISMTTILFADGNSTSITIPEIPVGLLENNLENSLKVGQLEFVQAAAENYSSYDNYEQYIANTLKLGQPYGLTSDKRERIWKSSVSQSLLPF